MPDNGLPKDIIAELSGIDSRHRISSKYAARELLHSGQFLFDIVLDKALSGKSGTGGKSDNARTAQGVVPTKVVDFCRGRAPARPKNGIFLQKQGNLAVRCAESCARAAEENPGLARKRSKEITAFILKKPEGDLRYFFASMLRHVKISRLQSKKCAALLEKWISEETGKGPRACYLETISALAQNNPLLAKTASRLIEGALQSPIPSFSARARQIVMRLRKNMK